MRLAQATLPAVDIHEIRLDVVVLKNDDGHDGDRGAHPGVQTQRIGKVQRQSAPTVRRSPSAACRVNASLKFVEKLMAGVRFSARSANGFRRRSVGGKRVGWQSLVKTAAARGGGIDGDPEKQRQDAEARAALANLRPIVLRGRFAWARDLSDLRKNQMRVFLIALKDVEVLRGEMHRSAWDRQAFIVRYAWCDIRCGSAAHSWRHGQEVSFGAHPFSGGPIRDTDDKDPFGTGKKVVYRGRVDAVMGACDPLGLTPLQEELLKAPADEIARLMREYPPHQIRKDQPAGSN